MNDVPSASGLSAFLNQVDRLLRGGFTREEDLRAGRIQVPTRTLLIAGVVLGLLYGACMGLYALSVRGASGAPQVLASAVKVPLLFLLTLVVSFPSLYVFSALARSRLRLTDSLRLMLASIAVTLALLASFATVVVFFTLCTDSYPFMVLLNVLLFGIAGFAGLRFLAKASDLVFAGEPDVYATPSGSSREGTEYAEEEDEGPPSPPAWNQRPRSSRLAGRVFAIWLFIYGSVGAQMGWVLRPFVGTPDREFSWFRERESNFFQAVLEALGELLMG